MSVLVTCCHTGPLNTSDRASVRSSRRTDTGPLSLLPVRSVRITSKPALKRCETRPQSYVPVIVCTHCCVDVERLCWLKKLPVLPDGISCIGKSPCGVTCVVIELAWKVDSSTTLVDSGAWIARLPDAKRSAASGETAGPLNVLSVTLSAALRKMFTLPMIDSFGETFASTRVKLLSHLLVFVSSGGRLQTSDSS